MKKQLSSKELTMHRLLGEHRFLQPVIEMCEICGYEKGKPAALVQIAGRPSKKVEIEEVLNGMLHMMAEMRDEITRLSAQVAMSTISKPQSVPNHGHPFNPPTTYPGIPLGPYYGKVTMGNTNADLKGDMLRYMEARNEAEKEPEEK